MNKHLLVTISHQQSALYGVRFAGNFFSNKNIVKITLLYIVPRGPQIWAGEKNMETVTNAEVLGKKNENRGHNALEAARRSLMNMGFHQDSIDMKLQHRKFSKAMDILQEGEKGLYDAVVLGSRGLSWIEAALDESVGADVLKETCDFPIWICRRPDLERKGVLLCIDGSEASIRMADHVGFMLSQEEGQPVTLFSVTNGSNENHAAETYLQTAMNALIKNNLPAGMIKTKVAKDTQAARAILAEAENGRYSAVAVGRTGAGRGLLGKIFIGSVSTKLFRQLEKTALWICY